MEKRSGTCPVCGRTYQVTQNGMIRKHWKRDGRGKGLPFSDPCAGSGYPPKPPALPGGSRNTPSATGIIAP